ncbi:MAG: hypothetical protein AAFW73_11940 [Bacteroidota bacterium]
MRKIRSYLVVKDLVRNDSGLYTTLLAEYISGPVNLPLSISLR